MHFLLCNNIVKIACYLPLQFYLQYYLAKFKVTKTIAMKNCISIIGAFMLLAFTPSILQATSMGEILGKITVQETNTPLAYAEVTFENSMGKVVIQANEYGMYYGLHIPSGRYEMKVNYNNRVFVMKQVRIYDGYTSEANFAVSNSDTLPQIVNIPRTDALYSGSAPTGITLTNNNRTQPTQQLSDVLSMQPGMDVRNGKLFVKGSSEVKFFIDGTPLIGPPNLQRVW